MRSVFPWGGQKFHATLGGLRGHACRPIRSRQTGGQVAFNLRVPWQIGRLEILLACFGWVFHAGVGRHDDRLDGRMEMEYIDGRIFS